MNIIIVLYIIMEPNYTFLSDDEGQFRFRLSGLNVSIANALRRIVLTEIPVTVIHTETYQDNKCNIQINTSRFHNEIIKQRISSIPIHTTDINQLPNNFTLEVDMVNDTDNVLYVTTEHFKIKNNKTDGYMSAEETREIFPANPMTKSFIDFVRLRPKISDTIPGEQLKLSAQFSVDIAKTSGMYAVVCKCAYINTMDQDKINQKVNEMEQRLIGDGISKEEIEFQKKNYMYLDAQRQFIPDSFDFTIQSIGIYENVAIMKLACKVLQRKFQELIEAIDGDSMSILNSEVTIDHCYDIVLANEDYTVGTVIEYLLHENYYHGDGILTYCGFKKMHPHDTQSIVRIAFKQNAGKDECRNCMRLVCSEAKEVFQKIEKMFVV